MKFYNYETYDCTLKDGLRTFLQQSDIYYELSGCGIGWHFEIKCDTKQAAAVNRYLDSMY